MKKISEIILSTAQTKVLDDKSRFRVLVAGRRFGKSFLIGAELLAEALGRENRVIVYLAPSFPMVRRILWPLMIKYSPPGSIKSTNLTNFTMEFINGSVLYMGGAGNYDAFRGLGIDFACIDEAADIPEEAWYEVVRPALSDKQGRALIVGTPEGRFNWFYNLTLDQDYSLHTFTTLEGGRVTEEEIREARRQLDEQTFRQEYEASFETSGSAVYYAYSDSNHTDTAFNPHRLTILAWDFNVNPMSTIIIQETDADKWVCVKEFVLPNSNTKLQCETIIDYLYGNNFRGMLQITGDYAGSGRRTSASFSDFRIIEKFFKNYPGYRIRTRPTKRQKDRANALNAMFRPFEGAPLMYVNPKECPKLNKDLRVVQWKEGAYEIDKREGISDPSDALSYFAYNYYPLKSKSESVFL